MARLVLALLLVLWPAGGQSIRIQFETVPKAEVERRLHAIERSNVERERKLKELFEEAGCTGERLTEQPVKHAKAPNIICTLPGETDSVILVGGHFDFVSAGHGAVDNWSGCSLLPSLFLSVKGIPRRHTFVFVGFTDEEMGMVGSKFYLDKMSKEEIKKVSAMVNLDSIGTSFTKIELDRGDKLLATALSNVAAAFKLPLGVVNAHAVGRSDSDSFQDRHIPAINIHSLTNETFPILHSPQDRMDAIQLDDYYNTYLLTRAYLAYLDQKLDAPDITAPAVVK